MINFIWFSIWATVLVSIDILWIFIELLVYGETKPSLIDTFFGVLLATSITLNISNKIKLIRLNKED